MYLRAYERRNWLDLEERNWWDNSESIIFKELGLDLTEMRDRLKINFPLSRDILEKCYHASKNWIISFEKGKLTYYEIVCFPRRVFDAAE